MVPLGSTLSIRQHDGRGKCISASVHPPARAWARAAAGRAMRDGARGAGGVCAFREMAPASCRVPPAACAGRIELNIATQESTVASQL